MKRRNIRCLICGAIQISVSALFFLAAAVVRGDFKDQTPFAVEVYDGQGLGVSMAQAAPFTERGAFAAASMGEQVQVTGLEGNKSVPAYYQTTTPNYGAYANLHLSEGEYFSNDASAGPAVVIPESLSKELFAGNGGKKELRINGTDFAVCGVYGDGGTLTQLGSANLPVIYGNASVDPNLRAEHLLIGADAGKTAQQQMQETVLMMQVPLEGEVNDLGRLHQLSDSILFLGFFFAGLWFVWHFCRLSYGKFILAYESKGDARQRGFTAFFAVGVLLLGVLGFAFLLQLVRIPAVYLPENNIFDLPYYGRQVLSGIQQIHADCRIKDFSRVCAVYLCAEAGLLWIAAPLFWAGCQKLRRGLLDGCGKVVP